MSIILLSSWRGKSSFPIQKVTLLKNTIRKTDLAFCKPFSITLACKADLRDASSFRAIQESRLDFSFFCTRKLSCHSAYFPREENFPCKILRWRRGLAVKILGARGSRGSGKIPARGYEGCLGPNNPPLCCCMPLYVDLPFLPEKFTLL